MNAISCAASGTCVGRASCALRSSAVTTRSSAATWLRSRLADRLRFAHRDQHACHAVRKDGGLPAHVVGELRQAERRIDRHRNAARDQHAEVRCEEVASGGQHDRDRCARLEAFALRAARDGFRVGARAPRSSARRPIRRLQGAVCESVGVMTHMPVERFDQGRRGFGSGASVDRRRVARVPQRAPRDACAIRPARRAGDRAGFPHRQAYPRAASRRTRARLASGSSTRPRLSSASSVASALSSVAAREASPLPRDSRTNASTRASRRRAGSSMEKSSLRCAARAIEPQAAAVGSRSLRTNARPLSRSSTASGDRSGCSIAETGRKNVCSSMNCPPSAAWST